MSSVCATMPSTLSESQSVFRFLDLPAELRSEVYAWSKKIYENVQDPNDLIAAGCDDGDKPLAYVLMIPPHLRQINREIKAEVEAQMRRDTNFVFEETDPGFFEDSYPKFLYRMLTQYTNHVVLKLQAWCVDKGEDSEHGKVSICTDDCTAVNDVCDHASHAHDFFDQFSQNFKSCEIEISIMRMDEILGVDWTDLPQINLFKALRKLARVSGLTALRVYKGKDEGSVLWLTWDQKGWRVPTEQVVHGVD